MAESTDMTTDLLSTVLDDLAVVVGGIAPGQSHDPTPCTEYDVTQLTNHVVGWLTTFAAGFADPDGRAPRSSLDGYTAPADPAAAVRAAAASLAAALRGGAASRPLRLGDAAMPGEIALGIGWRPPGGNTPLIARFQVDSAQPQPAPGVDGDWVGVMTFAKTFTSGIVVHRALHVRRPAGGLPVLPGHRADHRSHRGRTEGLGGRPARRPGVRSGLVVRPHRAQDRDR